jgi:hypothetical protein
VLVLDCDLDVAGSDLFFARSMKTRATVVLFGAPGVERTSPSSRASAAYRAFTSPPTALAHRRDPDRHLARDERRAWSMRSAVVGGALALTRARDHDLEATSGLASRGLYPTSFTA